MAENRNGRNGKTVTKADVILAQIERLVRQTASLEARVGQGGGNAGGYGEVIRKLQEENAKLKQEIRYVSAQIEGVCATITKMVQKLPSQIGGSAMPVEGADGVRISNVEFDYDALGYSVAKRIYVPQAIAEEIDYEQLAGKVADKLPPVTIDYDELGYSVAKRMYIPNAIAEDVDYDQIADKICEKVPAFSTQREPEYVDEAPVARTYAEPVSVNAEIDYDLLAAKVAEALPEQEAISADYIAARVAEQIIIPQAEAVADVSSIDLDVEELSRKVADKIALPDFDPSEIKINEDKLAEAVAQRLSQIQDETAAEASPAAYGSSIDEAALADDIASRLNLSLSDRLIADAVVQNLSNALDSEEIADSIAKRVGTISPEQFEITVDDDGCDSLARSIENKLNYETLASAVAEKLNPAFMAANTGDQIDAEELAREIADKLNVSADINEDSLAEKAAAVISNYMPEIDTDDIADKVIAGVIPALPNSPVLDDDLIVNSISERIVENPEGDLNVVIDEESITRISEEVNRENEGRFDKLEGDVEEIKEMLRSGVLVARTDYVENYEPTVEETETVVEEEVAEEPEEEVVEETVEESVEEEEEQLVTVSDIVGEEEEVEEEVAEEETEDENGGNNLVINAIVDDIDEDPTDGEVMPDGIPGISGGVDFANMMKYNRSFIARIIQGTDDQKNFYGRTKTALLSYKKVNSNVAWGAERFNKGRETIARFKIRGKTLCLYLALDPNEYAKSVYNHVDVSDNKSMHGTPMMVKIKSPLGVKKAIRLIDDMLAKRDGVKRNVAERDYAAMYPYETMEELIEDGLVKDVNK